MTPSKLPTALLLSLLSLFGTLATANDSQEERKAKAEQAILKLAHEQEKSRIMALHPKIFYDPITQKYGIKSNDTISLTGIYDDIKLDNDKFYVKKDSLWGVVDDNNMVIIPITHEKMFSLSSKQSTDSKAGAYLAKKQGKFGIYNDKGQIILPFEYDAAGTFDNGTLPLSKQGKWGVIAFTTDEHGYTYFDKPHHVLIEFKLAYDDVFGFSDELALVSKQGKYGYIDKTGQLVIDLIYDDATPFYSEFIPKKSNRHPLAFVTINQDNHTKVGVIDLTGKAIVPIIYDNIRSRIYDSFIKVVKDNKLGLYNRNGMLLLEPEYDTIFVEHCIFLVQKSCDVITEKDGIKQIFTIGQ